MRDHATEPDGPSAARAGTRRDDGPDGQAVQAAAAVLHRDKGVVSPASVMRLQRAAGNAGVSAALSAQTLPDDAQVQRAMSGDEAPAPLYPSSGEGEEDR